MCKKCKDRGFLIKNKTHIVCECISRTKLLEVMDLASREFASENKWTEHFRFERLLDMLPQFSVAAVAECEYYGWHKMAELLKDKFNVKSLR